MLQNPLGAQIEPMRHHQAATAGLKSGNVVSWDVYYDVEGCIYALMPLQGVLLIVHRHSRIHPCFISALLVISQTSG